MPNIAAVLKAEIARLAKKESKAATSQLKTASVRYRSDIAKLKKLLAGQEKTLASLKRQVQQHPGEPQPAEEPLDGVRFSAPRSRPRDSGWDCRPWTMASWSGCQA